jgi:hypothetical protein
VQGEAETEEKEIEKCIINVTLPWSLPWPPPHCIERPTTYDIAL